MAPQERKLILTTGLECVKLTPGVGDKSKTHSIMASILRRRPESSAVNEDRRSVDCRAASHFVGSSFLLKLRLGQSNFTFSMNVLTLMQLSAQDLTRPLKARQMLFKNVRIELT